MLHLDRKGNVHIAELQQTEVDSVEMLEHVSNYELGWAVQLLSTC